MPHAPEGETDTIGAVSGSFDDVRDALDFLVGRLAEHHLDALVLDLTRPDIGIPVARVTVPGLRSHRPRFAPGRLFDVPVSMGWLPSPMAESDLRSTAPFS